MNKIVLTMPSRWEAFKWRYFRIIPISGLIPFILPQGGYVEFIDWTMKLIYRDIIISNIFEESPLLKRLKEKL